MNTPEPCDTCIHLYADCMQDDNPAYAAECKLDLPMGKADCIYYVSTDTVDKKITDVQVVSVGTLNEVDTLKRKIEIMQNRQRSARRRLA